MNNDFYPIPPSFGALMKRRSAENGLIDELGHYYSFDELLRRFPPDQIEAAQAVKDLMALHKADTLKELMRILTYREFSDALVSSNVIPKLSVAESVNQNISLYLSSRPREYFFDPSYGCIIHGYDFRQLRDTPSKDQIKRSVEEYLRKFEKRVIINKVDIEISDVEEKVDGSNPRICRYIQIVISCTLAKTFGHEI
jgi:phage baseplate assembly protein W